MMHIPNQFKETNVETLQSFIRKYPLCTIITHSSKGMDANHIPLHVQTTPAPYGYLTGHIDKANPMAQDIRLNSDILAVFSGPSTYITPSWFATKKEGGKVVPTWNFAVVHARGKARVIDDKKWLQEQLAAFTDHNESAFPSQWHLSDAPLEFTEKLINGVFGLEIVITELIGKWKVNQNEPAINRKGVIDGLSASQSPNAAEMAALVAGAMER
jgi:transcriptional regulator